MCAFSGKTIRAGCKEKKRNLERSTSKDKLRDTSYCVSSPPDCNSCTSLPPHSHTLLFPSAPPSYPLPLPLTLCPSLLPSAPPSYPLPLPLTLCPSLLPSAPPSYPLPLPLTLCPSLLPSAPPSYPLPLPLTLCPSLLPSAPPSYPLPLPLTLCPSLLPSAPPSYPLPLPLTLCPSLLPSYPCHVEREPSTKPYFRNGVTSHRLRYQNSSPSGMKCFHFVGVREMRVVC